MRKIIYLALFFTALKAQAVVVSVSSFDGSGQFGITNSGGTTLVSSGSGFLAVGYFESIADGNLATSTVANLNTDFRIFGSSKTFNFTGAYSVSVDDGGRVGPTINTNFVNKFIYTIVGNNSSILLSTEFMIYKHSTQFTADEGFPIDTDIDAYLGDGSLLVGLQSGTVDMTGGSGPVWDRIQLQPIPEPSTLMLSALGGFALLRRRR